MPIREVNKVKRLPLKNKKNLSRNNKISQQARVHEG